MRGDDNHSIGRARSSPRGHNHRAGSAGGLRRIEVELQYEAPRAVTVFVAGDFNHWRAGDLRLRQDERGVWRVPLCLAPGRYEYRFIVDGEWHEDPRASTRVPNEFGSSNSVLEVPRCS
jgi:1,4-alpha-glucan branching enzyme